MVRLCRASLDTCTLRQQCKALFHWVPPPVLFIRKHCHSKQFRIHLVLPLQGHRVQCRQSSFLLQYHHNMRRVQQFLLLPQVSNHPLASLLQLSNKLQVSVVQVKVLEA